MEEYIKLFQNHTLYEAYKNSADYVTPNVSYCELQDEVHYNPIETRIVTKYNVTSTSEPTKIGYDQYISTFAEIEIDGVVQPTVASAYTFDTLGEHTVKYTLTDPASIGAGAFQNCTSLTSAIIPYSVTSIGYSAFYNCSSLTNVTIGNSVTSIGDGAFANCGSLTSIIIPNSVTNIGQGVFQSCTSLINITIGNGVTTIGNGAFDRCTSLTNVTIGNSVRTINSGAFQNCTSLTGIIIPNSVTNISDGVFYNCSSLTNIIIPDSVTNVGYSAFASCSSLANITSLATTAPTVGNNTFQNVHTNGTLTVPNGSSGYDTWMQNANYYLGKYNWTKVEQ